HRTALATDGSSGRAGIHDSIPNLCHSSVAIEDAAAAACVRRVAADGAVGHGKVPNVIHAAAEAFIVIHAVAVGAKGSGVTADGPFPYWQRSGVEAAAAIAARARVTADCAVHHHRRTIADDSAACEADFAVAASPARVTADSTVHHCQRSATTEIDAASALAITHVTINRAVVHRHCPAV